MKMTLSSSPNNNNNAATNDKPPSNNSDNNKSVSPTSSPRGSPRPSPRPQTKRDHSRPDSHLSVHYREAVVGSGKHDGSPSSQEGSIISRVSSTDLNISVLDIAAKLPSSSSSTGYAVPIPVVVIKERKEGRGKKKSSWFNSFYPTYKSRSEDFKRIFKDVPDDERLVVDYSCALQKEILVQGRLYITQNYLCFYANIFGWETNLTLKWKDVSAITKEKTALVIPNAVLICTRNDNKYFFTSFVARDKTYLMLFRVWQNALMDQPMTAPEMWQWVHQCYGDELGLTSDDEDYIAPGTEEDIKISSARLSAESFSEHECRSTLLETIMVDEKPDDDNILLRTRIVSAPRRIVSDTQIPTDMSDTTESDIEKPINNKVVPEQSPPSSLCPDENNSPRNPEKPPPTPTTPDTDDSNGLVFPNTTDKCDNPIQCTAVHEGRQLLNELIPIHIDQLFTLLFTSSKFYLDFHAIRKTTDLTQTPWTHNVSDNSKSRIVNLTVALNQTMGPKTAQVTESQIMLPCSKAGYLYAINVDTVNAGIPYADSFHVVVHYCIKKVSENETSLKVNAQIKYKKSMWGLVKGMIEKSVWFGLEDFYVSLVKAIRAECEENVPDVKRKSRRKRRIHSMPTRAGCVEDSRSIIASTARLRIVPGGIFNSDVSTLIVFTVLIMLVILNVMLYYKLWSLEESPPYTLLDLHILKDPPKSHDEWIKLLQQQETLHTVEIQKWQRILKTSIHLLKQTEESLNELQRSISPTYTNKIMTILQNHNDIIVEKSNDDSSEL